MQPGKKSFALPSGKEFTVDANLITQKEWRMMFSPDQSLEDEDAILARVCGLTVDEYLELSRVDWKTITRTIIDFLKDPLKDPNSPSGSGIT